MWKVLWISTGCRNQTACCLVACYHKNKRLIVKSHNFRDFDNKYGVLRAFFVVFFLPLFLKAQSPGAVALLRIAGFAFAERVKILEMWVWARKEVAQGEFGCTVNVPSCHAAFRHVVFVSWCCLFSRVQWTAILSQALAWHKSMTPKKPGFPRHKPQILRRFDAKLLFSSPVCPLGIAYVFPPQAVSVFWSGDKQ